MMTVQAGFVQRRMRLEILLVDTIASLQVSVRTGQCFSMVTFSINLIEFLSGYPVYMSTDESDQIDLCVSSPSPTPNQGLLNPGLLNHVLKTSASDQFNWNMMIQIGTCI